MRWDKLNNYIILLNHLYLSHLQLRSLKNKKNNLQRSIVNLNRIVGKASVTL